MPFFENIVEDSGAIFGGEEYRYTLWRTWEKGKPILVFVMLNPSTADHAKNDPTIKRCIDFAKRLGFGGIIVINLFAYRSKRPSMLRTAEDPIGPNNDVHIRSVVRSTHEGGGSICLAYGNLPSFSTLPDGTDNRKHNKRAHRVVQMIADLGVPMHVLDTTDGGHPRHPLYIPKTVGRRLKLWHMGSDR